MRGSPLNQHQASEAVVAQHLALNQEILGSSPSGGTMTHHWTLLKALVNPILRRFGWVIVSCIDDETQQFVRYELRRYLENCGPKKK